MNKLFFVTIFVTLSALVAGFIVPPTGVIHPSVLTACGILSFIALLCQLPTILSEKRKTTFKVGQSSVTIEDLIKEHYGISDVPPSHYSHDTDCDDLSHSININSDTFINHNPKYSAHLSKLNSNPFSHE